MFIGLTAAETKKEGLKTATMNEELSARREELLHHALRFIVPTLKIFRRTPMIRKLEAFGRMENPGACMKEESGRAMT